MDPPQRVAIQLKIFTPVGTAISIVEIAKAEFAAGPNLSVGGVGMVFSIGQNFTSGNLNLPINFAFVPGRDGSGSRFSIMLGFNMNR